MSADKSIGASLAPGLSEDRTKLLHIVIDLRLSNAHIE